MEDDMNTPLTLTYFYEILSLTNKKIDEKEFSEEDLHAVKEKIIELGDFFQIIPEMKKEGASREVEELIREREEARKKKNFKTADLIRKELKNKYGIILEDSESGVKWKKI